MKAYLLLLLPLTLLCGSQPVLCAGDRHTSLRDTILLQTVEVLSTTKIDVNRNQLPLAVSVVSRETIDESIEHGILSVLSEHVPGIFVTERSVTGYGISDGSAGTINIHGVGDGNRVLMLFDGQPNWAGIFGHHIPDVYTTSDAERIEIIRGPGSLLYGSNAMGGVVNVITRQATENGFHGSARTLSGSYNTWKIRGGAGYKKGKFDAYASLNRDQSDGHRDRSAFHSNNSYLKLNYRLADHWQASGNAIVAQFKVNNPGEINRPMLDNWAEALRGTYSLSLHNHYKQTSGALQAYYNHGRHKINDGYAEGADPQTNYFKLSDFNAGLLLYQSLRIGNNHLLTLGIDAKQWGGRAWNEEIASGQDVGTLMDTIATEWAGYILTQHTLDRWTIHAGIRLENNNLSGNEWVPQAGLTYRPNARTSLKASASKGFRSPNINDLFSPWGVSNPELRPEEMHQIDLSYIQSLRTLPLQFEITSYWAKGKNLIQLAPIAGGPPRKQNTGSFINKGIDAILSYSILPKLTATGNYSYLHSNAQLLAAPRHKAGLHLRWMTGKFLINPYLQHIGSLYLGTDGGTDITESYTLLNAKLSYKPSAQLTFFINGENLANASYQTYLGFPMPGTVVLAGLDCKF
jgi:iron complex outermembrane receptor protein